MLSISVPHKYKFFKLLDEDKRRKMLKAILDVRWKILMLQLTVNWIGWEWPSGSYYQTWCKIPEKIGKIRGNRKGDKQK